MQLKQKLTFTAVLLVLVVVLGVLSVREYGSRKELVFCEETDRVALTVDGRELTLGDLAFYIAHQEQTIEAEALIYNPDNTNEYWNLYTNHTFLRDAGKQAVIEMAVHDEIFYQMAVAEGIVLSGEEEAHLANDRYDFWSDLEEDGRAALGISEEELGESMRKVALAEKYQALFAQMQQKDFEEYSFTGEAYARLLEEHTYALDENVWERVPFGSVTVRH